MSAFEIKVEQNDVVPVIVIQGYFSDEAGKQLHEVAKDLLRKGKTKLIFNFSTCTVITSPGVAALMDLGLAIMDDFKGNAILCGLDKFKLSVLNLAGVVPIIEAVPDVQTALQKIKK